MSTPVILLPVDGSEHADRAMAYALKIAGLMSARVLVLYCHRPFPIKLGEPYFQQAVDKIVGTTLQNLADVPVGPGRKRGQFWRTDHGRTTGRKDLRRRPDREL